MDFIEQLPPSLGFTAILVIIDRLSKQGVFIPMVNTITSHSTHRTIRSPHILQTQCTFPLHL
jgi:hypothetical protein